MKKVLYIMGIEWNWIFQRPQIFALELQKNYEVTVACPKQPASQKNQENIKPEQLIELFQIPFQEKIGLIGWFANKIHKRILGNISEYDIIWVGYPIYGRYIPDDYKGTVVYDCMDNFEALYPDRRKKAVDYVLRQEQRLLQRADVVFASSRKLKEKLLKVCPDKKITVIRNGCGKISVKQPQSANIKNEYILGYIGTISEWFDNSVVEESLKTNMLIKYDLVGPMAKHQSIQHERVTYSGVIEHAKLGEYVDKLDCLLMPFIVSEIVLYVDPVKLYEYIAWGKCIIASWYPEIERFEDYVYFYRSKEEYVELLNDLVSKGFPPKYTGEQQQAFLKENTWEARMQTIKEALN